MGVATKMAKRRSRQGKTSIDERRDEMKQDKTIQGKERRRMTLICCKIEKGIHPSSLLLDAL